MKFTTTRFISSIFGWLFLIYFNGNASDLVGIFPVTDHILMLHFDDGYVDHYGLGEDGNKDVLHNKPFSTFKGMNPESYTLSSPDDANYPQATNPSQVGRKSKGKDFTSNWAIGLQYVLEHFIYLELPHPLQHHQSYRLQMNRLAQNTNDTTFIFDEFRLHSETIHVNQIGYAPAAPQKFAYLSHWMGDLGPLELDDFENSEFYLVDLGSDQVVYSGQINLRKDLESDGPDCAYPDHAPYGSYSGADVWLIDFSDFNTPGDYKIVVEKMGCSHPFLITDDVYREAFYTTMRGLYHQRCGTALEAPYTRWTRPRCHHPAETDSVILSDWRYMDGGNAFTELPQYATGEKRAYWGGWHDAADWDRHHNHLNAAKALMLAYEFRPENFSDDELNLPESGNGIPDILDEVHWCVDFFKRMQETDGGIHGGIETWRHPATGVSSVTDTDQWYAYAPDPMASFHYAGAACHFAYCLALAGYPEDKAEYISSARAAFQWGLSNTRSDDESMSLRDMRHYAAAWLFKITGEDEFHTQFKKDNMVKSANTELEVWQSHDQQWGVWTYVTTEQPNIDQTLKTTLSKACENWAYSDHINNADKRGYQFGNDWWRPVMVAQATTPSILPVMVAYHLTKNEKYLAYHYTACDYVLGANPLNLCWVPGIGEKYPREYMHLDSWYYNTDKGMVPGIIPYGPYWYQAGKGNGPWDAKWGMNTTYPDASEWPSHELWFENRYCPIVNEFTVHQTIGPAAAAFGYLCKPGGKFLSIQTRPNPVIRNGRLYHNFPNPFNTQTVIHFELDQPTHIKLAIYNLSGQLIQVLAQQSFPAGRHQLSWEGKNISGQIVSSGLYLVKLNTNQWHQTQKILLVK